MTRQTRLRRVVVVGALAAGLVFSAVPAFAQAMGSLRGQVVDEAGKPVPEADIVLDFVGDVQISVTFKTNTRGEFVRSGLRTGEWRLQATKGPLSARLNSVRVTINEMNRLDAIVIKAASATTTAAAGMSKKEVEERNKMMAAMQAEFDTAVASIATDPDGAIARLTNVASQVPDCAICYTRIGDAYMKKNDEAAAEAAYKKAIELDPALADSYSQLAVLYNQQKKFDEASAMSAKANELRAASATGLDPADVYNQGIIYWNAGGKAAEAKAQFEKAIQLDPKMADAHYWLGMANLNLGQLPDAVKAFEAYLKVAPDGQHAEMAKGILKQIK